MHDLHWAAGFLEGEGSFFVNNGRPVIKATNGDLECLEWLRVLFGGSIQPQAPRDSRVGKMLMYQWRVTGRRAGAVMLDLRELMSNRRKAQIDLAILRCGGVQAGLRPAEQSEGADQSVLRPSPLFSA